MQRLLAPFRDRFTVAAMAVAAAALVLILVFGRPNSIEARTTLPENAATAPAAPARLAGFSPNLSDAALSGRQVRIGVFGDSFGDGIWWALERQLGGEADIALRRLAQRSTGFTSYGHLNLLEDIRAKLDRQPLDIAVLSFGANDTQGITIDGRHLGYMSEDWQAVVGARLDAVVGLLRERGAQVYWVGLPRMRAPAFERKVRALSGFLAARMRALGVPFVDTVASTSDLQGHYAARLPDPATGRPMLARSGDGVHMTMKGYTILTRGLARHLRRLIASARAEAARDGARQASSLSAGAAVGG